MIKNIAITDTYLNSVFKLDNSNRKLTLGTVKELANNPKSGGLQIHNISRMNCDSKFRSARVTQDYRLIFAMLGDKYLLLYVDRHDAAYDWCIGKFLEKTDFGSEYIYDELEFKKIESKTNLTNIHVAQEIGLLERYEIKAKHLVKIGVSDIHSKNLVKIVDENEFLDYIVVFPAEIQEALLDLMAGDKSIEEVYNKLIDPDFSDVSLPLSHKDSKRRFYTPESEEELEALMENDTFEKWQIFLHPTQSSLVTRNFNGPVLIEGGPGTGKTIVGIHRAAYLAEKVFKKSDNKKILFCTFSRKLSKVISEKLDVLLKQRNIPNNIEVVSVDLLIANTLAKLGIDKISVNQAKFNELFDFLYNKIKPEHSKKTYEKEYFEVIEKYNIKTLDEYLEIDRVGLGLPLDSTKRRIFWIFFSELLDEKQKLNAYTFCDRAQYLLNHVSGSSYLDKYDAVIIDEAQDLELVKLKSVLSLINEGPNCAMILSDINQRIFKLTSWKKELSLKIQGRTYYLDINYRTTKQISDYARYQFMLTEINKTHLRDYKSITVGADPKVIAVQNDSEQLRMIVSETKVLLSESFEPHQICIICNTKEDCLRLQSVMTYSDIETNILSNDEIPTLSKGVCLCPIAGVKGLEFECVIIYDYMNIGLFGNYENESTAIKLDFSKLVECEKYVAATRARELLIITYIGGE